MQGQTMHAFILVSKDQKKQQNYLEKFCNEHAISTFDQTRVVQEGSIGVEVIRKLQESFFLKPFQSKEKIFIIDHAENLTSEAQNAMLKILEEPPANTYICLLAKTEESFLPTILSRCTSIQLDTQKTPQLIQEEKPNFENELDIIIAGALGDKLALAEKIAKDKNEASVWLEKMITLAREKMLENTKEQKKFLQLIMQLQEAHKTITTTNVSLRIALEHCFLSRVS